MACKGLYNEDIINMMLDTCDDQSDDLEDIEEDHILSDDDGDINNLLSDNRTSDENDKRDENMLELDPSTSDIRTNK